MKCEICKIKEATVHFKQVDSGDIREMYVCEECAAKNGFDPESPMSLTDFLFGVGMQAEPVLGGEDTKCQVCGMARSEFMKKTRLGCESCYDVFKSELEPMIEAMHNGLRHVGKIPSNARQDEQVEALRIALAKAVRQEDFEEAAILRDRMHELSGEEPL